MLQLNEQQDFKEFYGRNVDQMPLLVAEGRAPLSARGLMNQRLAVLNSTDAELRNSWWNNYFDTGDAVFYHPDGKVKIVLDAPIMRELTSESTLVAGGLKLGNDRDESVARYDALDGQEFSRKELGTTGEGLSLAQAKKHPVWKALAGGDQSLLQEYADAAFRVYKINSGMGVYVSDKKEVAFGRLWCLGSIYNNSNAFGNLDNDIGRLVGVVSAGGAVEKVPRSGAQENGTPDSSQPVVVVAPSLEQILALGKERIAPALWKDFDQEARKLYQK